MFSFLKTKKEILLLIILAGVFCWVYSFLPLAQLKDKNVPLPELTWRFNTPDEVINFYFTDLYASQQQLFYEEPLNLLTGGTIFPRWAKPAGERITPGTFQGIILIYGNLARVVGRAAIPFLTPFLAVLGVIVFYFLIKEFFIQRVALVAALLMFIFPGFWYYASRTLFHNVLFLVCLLSGLLFFIKVIKTDLRGLENRSIQIRRFILAILTGLFFGLALITRTSEVVWVALVVLIILLILKPRMNNFWLPALVGLVVGALCFLPVFHNNKILYGSYFSFGYTTSVATDLEDISSARPLGLVQALLLPFGFHPLNIARVFYHYFLKLFWPWLILWAWGLIWFLKTKPNKEQKLFMVISLMVSCWLLIYYGSWKFSDNLSGLVSIGSSYVRYFLPSFIFGLPLAAWVLVKLERSGWLGKTALLVVCCWLLVASWHQVFRGGPEGLIGVKNNLLIYRQQAAEVLKLTKENDIILVDISQDKIIFPERRHIIVPQGGEELKAVPLLLKMTEIYFFYRAADVNVDFLNEKKFKPYGLEIYEGQKLNGGGILFRVREFERKLSVSS